MIHHSCGRWHKWYSSAHAASANPSSTCAAIPSATSSELNPHLRGGIDVIDDRGDAGAAGVTPGAVFVRGWVQEGRIVRAARRGGVPAFGGGRVGRFRP